MSIKGEISEAFVIISRNALCASGIVMFVVMAGILRWSTTRSLPVHLHTAHVLDSTHTHTQTQGSQKGRQVKAWGQDGNVQAYLLHDATDVLDALRDGVCCSRDCDSAFCGVGQHFTGHLDGRTRRLNKKKDKLGVNTAACFPPSTVNKSMNTGYVYEHHRNEHSYELTLWTLCSTHLIVSIVIIHLNFTIDTIKTFWYRLSEETQGA